MLDDALINLFENTDIKMSKTKMLKFFKLAKSASEFSDFKQQHLGAVIVQKGRVLTVGWNTRKEIPMQRHFNSLRGFNTSEYPNCAHAEMNAISKLVRLYNTDDIDFSKTSIFIYRERGDNQKLALAKPCVACMAAIRKLGIRHLYYTGNESIISETLVI